MDTKGMWQLNTNRYMFRLLASHYRAV